MSMVKICKEHQIEQQISFELNFVGRKAERDSFWQDYKTSDINDSEWDLRVNNYYGMSGVGKTELANQLFIEHHDNDLEAVYFAFADDQSLIENILELKATIETKLNVLFPMFDLAYMIFCNRSGRRNELKKQKEFLDSNLINALLPIMEGIPKVGIIAKILEVLKPYESTIRRKLSDADIMFVNDSPDRIFAKLPYYFANDLQNAVSEKQKIVTIFLDNTEAFVKGKDFDNWFMKKNTGLFWQISEVVWCVFSQSPMCAEQNLEHKFVRSYPLKPLSYEEVIEYLEKLRVEEKYYKDIFTVTDGIPVYLSIICESYFQHVKRNELSNFAVCTEKEKLVGDYLKYLDPETQKIVKVLAFLETWNDDLAVSLLGKLGVSVNSYEEILLHTYIKKSKGKYYIHSLIGEIVRREIPSEFMKQMQVALKELSNQERNSVEYNVLYYKAVLDTCQDDYLNNVIVEISKYINQIVEDFDFDLIYKLHGIIVDRVMRAREEIWAESISYFFYAKLYSRAGLLAESMEKITMAHEIITTSTYKEKNESEFYHIFRYSVEEEYANILCATHNYAKSKEIRERLLVEMIKKEGKKSFSTFSAQQNYYATLIHIAEDREEALRRLKHLLHERQKIILRREEDKEMNHLFTIYLYDLLAEGYSEKGDFSNAIDYAAKAADASFQKDPNSHLTAQILNSFSMILLDQQSYAPVIELLGPIYENWKEILPEESELIMSMKYSLGVAYGENDQPEEGMKLLSEIYIKAYDMYGDSDKKTLKYKKEYALCVAKNGDHKQAVELLVDCKNVYERIYGYDQSEQLRNIIHSLIVEYRILHDIESEKKETDHFVEVGYDFTIS